ncbi:Protein phosphatase 2C-like domain-containing protein 1 [Phytophthora pseudosyringae]|uniref:Protein phosphatase 2C-like domain-containing protein 1 n=1 Tax=Phytophthora pseudosyringae TaxID=221518 RepID=A0A8T1WE30_9STRA|nr:Protein phosphatase 2C-like domain-containing protein 1 [Phytophthora pseudosyringae]
MTRLLLLLLLLLLPSLVLALEVPEADVTSRKLLTDRAWFSQVAQVPRRVADDAVACVAVSDPLRPGLTVEGYELVERSGLLGVCKHQQTQQMQHTQWPVQTRDRMEIVPWSTTPSDGNAQRTHESPVCPLPGAASASQRFPVSPLPLPESTETDADFQDHSSSPEGPVLEYQYVTEEAERIYVNAHYRLKKKFDAGSHGEVWRATRRHGGREEHFVLKRLFLELGESMAQMGLREAHFGALLHGERHVTRFVEYFFRPAKVVESPRTTPELWLVFYDEGKSLRQYLYEKIEVVYGADGHGAGVVLQPSRFWEKLRTDARGENVLREIMRQLLQGVAALHARGITHRDIKPSNILVSIPPSSSASAAPPMPLVKLADFGSAVDDYTLKNLYAATGSDNGATTASAGPSQAEETREYQPPEVLFSDNGQPYDYTAPEAYDLWSVGVVFLEMVLGSPQVFLISPRERAKLDVVLDAQQRRRRHRHDSEEDAESGWRTKAYLLHVLTQEFCIFQPGPRQLRSLWDKYALVSESCHFGRFNQTVVERDPLKRGLEDSWGLDLMWRLLQWHPSERITADEALQHAYFQGAYVCKESGRRFATHQELLLHERYLDAQRARESIFASVVRAKYELPDRFTCPHCGRAFSTAQSCEQHAHARRHNIHSSFCEFEAAHIPAAIRTESESSNVRSLPAQHPAVGIALFQGRKKYMEDFVLVLTEQQLQHKWSAPQDDTKALGFDLYAVVDGHLGSAAATFVVENLPRVLSRHFAAIPKATEGSTRADANANAPEAAITVSAELELAEKLALRQTFLELHEGFLESLDELSSDGDVESASKVTDGAATVGEYFSGCTLTVVLHFRREQRVVSANVGDSRALAWLPGVSEQQNRGSQDPVDAGVVPLSMDHWPNDPGERSRIESSGGFVNFSGLWRVVGQLAVSRSLGDRHLRKFVTAEPSVFHAQLGERTAGGVLVVASDGLWETMNTDDVVRFLSEKKRTREFAGGNGRTALDDLATDLLTEGYIRGSLDNMAIVLVALSEATQDVDS